MVEYYNNANEYYNNAVETKTKNCVIITWTEPTEDTFMDVFISLKVIH